MRSLTVYCGSAPGHDPVHRRAAAQLGRAMAERGWRLVFGGGSVGLMGVLADACLEAGGQVLGVIPRALYEWEVGHDGCTELAIVADMHERKARMTAEGDAFLALPGGIGTLEELFEMYTWLQLGFHEKPVGVLDTDGYYAGLFAQLDHSVKAGFLSQAHRELLFHCHTVPGVFAALEARM